MYTIKFKIINFFFRNIFSILAAMYLNIILKEQQQQQQKFESIIPVNIHVNSYSNKKNDEMKSIPHTYTHIYIFT